MLSASEGSLLTGRNPSLSWKHRLLAKVIKLTLLSAASPPPRTAAGALMRAKVEEYKKRGCTCPILYLVRGNFKLLINMFAHN